MQAEVCYHAQTKLYLNSVKLGTYVNSNPWQPKCEWIIHVHKSVKCNEIHRMKSCPD